VAAGAALMKLVLGGGLSLPLEVVTQTIGVVAKRRAGKSYLMRRLTEQLFKAGQQVVIVDPKGDQWGIRSAADGRSPGLPIVILGGERGDAPLEVEGGEIVAKLVVEERVSVLLDLSVFRKGEVARFMAAFLEGLYRLKAREQYRTPVMLVIDEADAIAPQRPAPGEERMLGAAEDIVRRGGQRGIGCTLVTQRTAVLNKNVLTQAQILVALRTIAPQDLKAMNAWIDVHGTDEERKTLMASLPSLPVGDAWFWSPGWPSEAGIFRRIHVDRIETFDSGATPKPGEKRAEPKSLADVDLAAIRRQMADAIERKKADDPRELRKRVAELEREVQSEKQRADILAQTRREPKVERVEVPVLTDAHAAVLGEALRAAKDLSAKVDGIRDHLWKAGLVGIYQSESGSVSVAPRLRGDLVHHSTPAPAVRHPAAHGTRGVQRSTPASNNGRGDLGAAERAFLAVLAHRDGKATTRNQLAVISGYSAKSRHVDNTLAALRSGGYVEGGRDHLAITDAGRSALGRFDPLPTGQELAAYWIRKLGTAGGAMLQKLVDVYPRSMTRNDLAEATGYSVASRHVDNTLALLRTHDVITGGRGDLRASAEFFE